MLLFRLAWRGPRLLCLPARPARRGPGRLPWAFYALEDPARAGAGARQPGSPARITWSAPPPLWPAPAPGLASDLQQLAPLAGAGAGAV